MMGVYPPETEQVMRTFYNTLDEKSRRRYAGIEAKKLGHGGITYIAKVLGCFRHTVSAAIKELESLPEDCGYDPRIRTKGGGRKPFEENHPQIDEAFLDVLKNHTAGDPQDEQLIWTNLTLRGIVQKLDQEHNIKVSPFVIKRLLKKHNFKRKKAQKKRTLKSVENRNEQFENIAKLKEEFMASDNPIISIDTKQKELLGNIYRDGKLLTREEIQTLDHDFPSYGDGIVVPHGIYDLKQNKGIINIGTSKDTSEFVTDCTELWWSQYGVFEYPDADKILILCDGGGSNGSRHYIFKADLQNLVNRLNIPIRIAHYPPYCSKYNPIEHRLFPHMTRASNGVIFTGLDIVQEVYSQTETKTGLHVVVNVIDKVYQTGRKAIGSFKESMQIVFDELLPRWNYTALPQSQNVQII
jgi:transposase